MKALRKGSGGAAVRQWQTFLVGRGHQLGAVDGKFGNKTVAATKAFQRKVGLDADGVVGNATFGKAMVLGFGIVSDADAGEFGDAWPPRPDFEPLKGNAGRVEVFGRFRFEHTPTARNPEAIRILGNWTRENIKRVHVPQLASSGVRPSGRVRVHRFIADQFLQLWQAWDDAGLLDRVVSWHGSFVPRLIRGGTTLSNHSFGSAFDINLTANRLGHVPALKGQPGSVRELVPIAHEHGFYWGGHFKRRDGMHFEVAEVHE